MLAITFVADAVDECRSLLFAILTQDWAPTPLNLFPKLSLIQFTLIHILDLPIYWIPSNGLILAISSQIEWFKIIISNIEFSTEVEFTCLYLTTKATHWATIWILLPFDFTEFKTLLCEYLGRRRRQGVVSNRFPNLFCTDLAVLYHTHTTTS